MPAEATPQLVVSVPKSAHIWSTPKGTSVTSTAVVASPNFELATTKRQLEKYLGLGAERIALEVETATTHADFIKVAMKTKGILHNLKPTSVHDPFWSTIGIRLIGIGFANSDSAALRAPYGTAQRLT